MRGCTDGQFEEMPERAAIFCEECEDVGCAACHAGNAPDLDSVARARRIPEAPQLSMWELMCL